MCVYSYSTGILVDRRNRKGVGRFLNKNVNNNIFVKEIK